MRAADKLIMPVLRKAKTRIRKSTAEIFAERFARELKLSADTIKNVQIISRNVVKEGLLDERKPATVFR